ncbi:MAG: phage portal protein family protein [Campylobacterota bacterium]
MKPFFKNLFSAKQQQPSEKKDRTVPAAPAVDILKSVLDNLPVRGRWLSREELDRILRDATVISSLGSRKAATLKKELMITADEQNKGDLLYTTFDHSTMRKILDAPFQGASIFEINWIDNKGLLVPKLIERPYEQFMVKDTVLYYAPYGTPQDIPPYKAIAALYEDKYHRPMGTPLAESLFWYVKFKNASLEFWVKFLEKYGVPWAIGKTDGDKDTMADEIYAMLSGDAAVIDHDEEIEIKTADKTGDFDKITAYLDDQIREAVLGGNLTGNVKGGSYAAAEVHNDVREDIAMADENMTISLIEKVVQMFVEINHLPDTVEVSLKDKDDPNYKLAERDEKIANMGYRPTKEYIEKTYNITVEEASSPAPLANRSFAQKLISLSATRPISDTDTLSGLIDLKTIALSFQTQIAEIIDGAESFEEAIDRLHAAYPQMDISELQETMDIALQSSYILGTAEAEFEEEEE